MIEGLNRIVDKVEGGIVTLLMLLAAVVAIAQVVARYAFNSSLYWSEEFLLYALISMSFLTMGMGVRYAAHISVEAGLAFAGERLGRALKIGAAVLGLIFAAVLIVLGWRLSANTLNMGQLSPAMRIPVGYVYLVIPVSGVFMVLRYLLVLSFLITGRDYTPPQSDIKNA